MKDEIRLIEKNTRWAVLRFLPLFLLVVAFLTSLGFVLDSLGLFGHTVVERKVFENSYQRSESLKSEIATNEAVLAEIQRKLSSVELDPATRRNLEAQAAAARIRIATARGKQ